MVPATKITTVTVNWDTKAVIENGDPIFVHGVIFKSVTNNVDVIFLEADQTTLIYRTYADVNFGDAPSYTESSPFLADKGLVIAGTLPFTYPAGPENMDAEVTILYSKVGL